MNTYIFFNPSSGSDRGEKIAHKLDDILKSENLVYYNVKTTDISAVVDSLSGSERIIICGGDGTLNSFINCVDTDSLENPVYLYPSGSGNDFLLDTGNPSPKEPVYISEYIKKLPVISVNGKTYKFINGAGAGIDGYACYECNRIRSEKKKKASYVSVALKGILKGFATLNGKLTIDGNTFLFNKMWLASIMKGRFCGSGLMFAPEQNRNSDSLTFLTAHNISKFGLLIILPTVFFGKHIWFKKNVKLIEGKDFHVEFDRPVYLQIDGETIPDVKEFRVTTGILTTPEKTRLG